MGFGGSGGGGGSIASSSDVALNSPTNAQALTYDSATAKWKNATVSGGSSPTVETIPAGSTLTVQKSGGIWPARPTARTDVVVQWKGPDPSPAIVSSGTGGMLDNVDVRFVTP